MKNFDKISLIKMVKDREESKLEEKAERLRLLISNITDEYIPMSSLAFQYFEEARLCYYHGAFIATIFMVHLAFEELLRNHYRIIRGQKEKFMSKNKGLINVDEASFLDLIDEAKEDNYITKEEAKELHRPRKLRNRLQHTKDAPPYKTDLKSSWFGQALRIKTQIEKDAEWAIGLLLTTFVAICKRWNGF